MSVKTVFTLRMEEKNQQTGEIKYNVINYLTPADVTQIEIETEAAEEVVEFSKTPEIIPLGIKACGATIVGEFNDDAATSNKGSSRIYPVSKLSLECRLEDTIQLFDKIDDASRTFAISIDADHNRGGSRELMGGIWRIDKFTWDRKAKEMGIYRFNMKLGYVWVDKREQRIYYGDTGKNKRETCKFTVNIEAGGNNNQEAKSNVEVSGVVVNRSLLKLNTCSFKHDDYIKPDSIVTLNLKNAQRPEDKDIFYGIVIKCDQGKEGLNTIECREIAELLYRGIMSAPQGAAKDPITGILPIPILRVKFNNPDNSGRFWKIKDMVRSILSGYYKGQPGYTYDPGKGVDRTTPDSNGVKIGDKEVLPGPGREKLRFGTQMYSCVPVGKALTEFVYRQCGLYVWYDYKNKGKMEYGFTRDKIQIDITREVIEKNILIESRNEDIKPDGVIVWNPDGKYMGVAGEVGNNKALAVYVFSDTKTGYAYNAIAHSLLEMLRLDNQKTYKVTFPAGTVRFKEGDYFDGLGDSTIGTSFSGTDANMDYRSGDDLDPLYNPKDSVWHVKEVKITEACTEVVVGTSHYSITDIYRDTLSRTKDGVAAPIEQYTLKCKHVTLGGENSAWQDDDMSTDV